MVCAFLASIAKRFSGAGLKDVLIESCCMSETIFEGTRHETATSKLADEISAIQGKTTAVKREDYCSQTRSEQHL